MEHPSIGVQRKDPTGGHKGYEKERGGGGGVGLVDYTPGVLGPGLTPCELVWEAQPRNKQARLQCRGSCAQMLPCYEIISRPQRGERVDLSERSIPLGGFSGS